MSTTLAAEAPAAGHPTPRGLRLARIVFALTVLVALASLMMELRVPGEQWARLDMMQPWPDMVAGVAAGAAGMAVLAHRRHPLGWVLAGFGLWWVADNACVVWLAEATRHQPFLPGASTAFWTYQRLGAGLLLLLPLVLLLHPDGRLPRGRWRVAALASIAGTALLPLVLVTVPSRIAEDVADGGTMPALLRQLQLDPFTLPLPEAAWTALLRASYLLLPLSMATPFLVVVGRYHRATGLRRRQLRWLLWAAVMDLLVVLAFRVVPGAVTSIGLTICVVVTAGSVAVALVRPDLVDVDVLLGSTVVYGALLVASYPLDLLVLGLAGKLLGTQLSDGQGLLLGVFVVSVVYAPLRHRLWALVHRTARGERHDPYRVVSRLAERLDRSAAPEDQLDAVARAVGRAFRSSYVGVEVVQANGSRLLVEEGTPSADVEAMPISWRGEQIGRLLLPRGPRRVLRPSDARLLADVVRQAAAATRAAQLAEELQASRERMVTAVEDERRRLRNELHDGLGPMLAAVASRIDVARMDPSRAEPVLGQAREEITGLLAEVRRLVYGLRPPALDDVGLVGAVRQQVDRIAGPSLDVRLSADDALDDLPAAVEVAALRIVSEALANVVRHAAASTCTVGLAVADGALVAEVVDDGRGIDPDVRAGVGLVSLRDRAGELGGWCRVSAAPGGGTVVRAELPLPAHERGDVDVR